MKHKTKQNQQKQHVGSNYKESYRRKQIRIGCSNGIGAIYLVGKLSRKKSIKMRDL